MIHLDGFGGHVFRSKAAPPTHNDKVAMGRYMPLIYTYKVDIQQNKKTIIVKSLMKNNYYFQRKLSGQG